MSSERIPASVEAAIARFGASLPRDAIRTCRLMDGVVRDGEGPGHYAASFPVRIA